MVVSPARSQTETLPSFSFFCHVSYASFSSSSWICPGNIKQHNLDVRSNETDLFKCVESFNPLLELKPDARSKEKEVFSL